MAKHINLKEKKKQINKRWSISAPDSPEEAFQKFKQRVLNVFKDIKVDENSIGQALYKGIDEAVTKKSITDFCTFFGTELQWKIRGTLIPTEYSTNIIDYLSNEVNPINFYTAIEIILSLKFRSNHHRLELIRAVKEIIEISDVNVAIGQDSDGYIILYPKGEKKLDDELVNNTLSFLNKESNKHFEEALRFYQKKKSRDSADHLRRSIEEFLRYKLGNQKGFEQNITTLQKKLKITNDQSEVRNIIFKTFDYIDKCFNKNSKHGNQNIGEAENEFLIYQTGLLMRYINEIIPNV